MDTESTYSRDDGSLSTKDNRETGFFGTREVMEQSDLDFGDNRETTEGGDPGFCGDRQVLEQSEPEIGMAEETNVDMAGMMMHMLSKDLIHIHKQADDSRLISQTLIDDHPTEPEIMQYEELTVRQRVDPEVRSNELASPLYKESDKSSCEMYMRVEFGGHAGHVTRGHAAVHQRLQDRNRKGRSSKKAYRMQRAEAMERFRRREEERMRREEEKRRRREEEDLRSRDEKEMRRIEQEKMKQLEEEKRIEEE
jgi:hypothetical protein